MRIKMAALVILLFIAGCAQAPKRTEVISKEFGPFFLPANVNLNSISINYFTASAEPTSVFFSMVGDIDWLRKDNTPSLFHTMVFSGLEESAIYQFRVDAPSEIFSGRSFIKTPPYGGNYRFDFAVVCMDSTLVLQKSPHFLILLSKKAAVGEAGIHLVLHEKQENTLFHGHSAPVRPDYHGQGFFVIPRRIFCPQV